ncbi:unnamed protein product [Strongylus vulgaris]|uniref:Uncharacterized protein n=1 Tax=Strongylus vulgaris TaxID=40348 RepID=A0A3P7I9M2_STRVU|nr:unnamed protein product [Strongylus vulgaris]
MIYMIFFLFSSSITIISPFIVGGCIGPKSVLERYLKPEQKAQLRKYIHSAFDGTNSDQVLANVNTYVHSVLLPDQWNSILPELRMYQGQKRECSIYAQLLPTEMYKKLVRGDYFFQNSVFKAKELGADDHDLRRLVEDYVERAMQSGLVPQKNIPAQLKTAHPSPSAVRYKPRIRYYPQRIIHELIPPPLSRTYVPKVL